MQASGAQLMKAPSPIVMCKQLQDGDDTFMVGGSPPEAHNLAHQLLPPRPPPGPPAADEDAAGAGLMTRVTSLFNRALCKPSSRCASLPCCSFTLHELHTVWQM